MFTVLRIEGKASAAISRSEGAWIRCSVNTWQSIGASWQKACEQHNWLDSVSRHGIATLRCQLVAVLATTAG